MGKSVILNLGKGNLESGFSFVTASVEADSEKMQITGSLGAAPELIALYQRWQLLYQLLYQSRSFSVRNNKSGIVINDTGITNFSDGDFADISANLKQALDSWLNTEGFEPIQRHLRNHLSPDDEIRFIIQTEEYQLSQLPWYAWQFFQDYPLAEVSLSNFNYKYGTKIAINRKKVRILAILGDADDINLEVDKQLLANLADAEIVFLVKPTCQELNEQLWSQQGWDILFFAGHSSTESQEGKLYINPNESITLEQLKNALKKAIARGLHLAIFNSCEGLGLAQKLSDLNIPQTIVMREPVPDRVAQDFLKYFLTEFSRGQSFYLAVREAREKLQGIETEFPGASWLPVVFQNPASPTPTWEQLRDKTSNTNLDTTPPLKLTTTFFSSLIVTGAIAILRLLGGLQTLELKEFDRFTHMMPQAPIDERILIIGADEKDISSDEGYGYPLPDSILAQVLNKAAKYKPAAVGVDIFRDRPLLLGDSEQNQDFTTHLQQNPQTITVCFGQNITNSIAAPAGSSPQQAAFADLYNDSSLTNSKDYDVRRYLLSRTPNPVSEESKCKTPYSFAFLVAYRYFKHHNIPVKVVGKDWQVGSTLIKRLQERNGGYQKFDSRGNQILIRYRNTPHIAREVSIREFLSDENNIDPNWIKDRVVLIGVNAATVPDVHDTPIGKLRGLQVHAHVVSQLLDGTEETAFFWWLPLWADFLWIGIWSLIGGIIVRIFSNPLKRVVGLGTGAICFYGICWFIFTNNGWLPLVPGILALLITGSSLIVYSLIWQKSKVKS